MIWRCEIGVEGPADCLNAEPQRSLFSVVHGHIKVLCYSLVSSIYEQSPRVLNGRIRPYRSASSSVDDQSCISRWLGRSGIMLGRL